MQLTHSIQDSVISLIISTCEVYLYQWSGSYYFYFISYFLDIGLLPISQIFTNKPFQKHSMFKHKSKSCQSWQNDKKIFTKLLVVLELVILRPTMEHPEIWSLLTFVLNTCDKLHCFHGLVQEQGKSEGFESCDRSIIWVKMGDVLYRVTLKFDGWPWKTIGHLSFAVSSFVQHFIAINWWIQTGVTVWKRPIWVKIDNF